MTDFNRELIREFWRFVQQYDDDGIMVIFQDGAENDAGKLLAYFDTSGGALDMFADKYGNGIQEGIPCMLIRYNAIRVEITPGILGLENETLSVTPYQIWLQRPDFPFRTEW